MEQHLESMCTFPRLVGVLSISMDDIVDFVLRNGEGHFDSAKFYMKNFLEHWRRLIENDLVMVFVDNNEEITGVCSWAVMWDKDKRDINKTRWILPDNIAVGNVLYIDVCVLTKGASIFKIKKLFEEMGYRKFIKEVFWFNMPKGRLFNKEVTNV